CRPTRCSSRRSGAFWVSCRSAIRAGRHESPSIAARHVSCLCCPCRIDLDRSPRQRWRCLMKVRRHPWLVLPGVLVIAIATGCGHNAAPTAAVPQDTRPTPQVARDLAQNVSTTLSRDRGVPIDQVGTTRLEAAAQGRADAVRALRSATALDERNLSWSLTVVFYDADGHEQLTFVPGVTARATIHANVRGSLSSAEHTASVGIERMLDVSGLLPAETELHIDGAAHDTAHCAFEAQDGSAARRYDLLSQGSL